MLAIIGGTGLYELKGMQVQQHLDQGTPFGQPSGSIAKGRLGGRELLFLARHGSGHRLLPHEVNYRANVFALKRAGATQIVGFSAVGSLAQHIAPGELVLPSQYFDWTKGGRARSFFGGGVVGHVSTAQPVSAALCASIAQAAERIGIAVHRDATYACVEGPRLGTRAESLFLRQAGCQLVGMTNVPEVFLAREAQICYAAVCIVTDYDCWMDDPAMHVSIGAILAAYRSTLERARTLLDALLAGPPAAEEPEIRGALQHAMLTPDSTLSGAQREWLAVLRR
ncbi:MAG TPA: S-methyl-5'-thioinosine phosphorylase [Rubrivivax sp.]|nr:S-methyl-5'-thioinosine phosphorylase [Rubrivivax sp.]